jgi:hypothetical protein
MYTVIRIASVIIYILILFGLLSLRFGATQLQDAPSIWLYDILIALWFSVGGLFFKRVRDSIQNIGDKIFVGRAPKLRMLVYGLSRSGKSTVIDRFLSVDKYTVANIRKKSTPEFNIQDAEITLGTKKKRFPVAIADYKGQTPDEIVTEAPDDFFGIRGDRRINVILFIVDLFPEKHDSSGNAIEDTQLLRFYKSNTEEKILKQVKENKLYVNKFSIQPVFSVSYNASHTLAVRLFINKADLLEELVDKGLLKSDSSIYEYCMSMYSDTIESIKKACTDNGIGDFSVYVISAGRGLFYDKQSKVSSIDFILGELLHAYSSKVDRK